MAEQRPPDDTPANTLTRVRGVIKQATDFWTKLNEDWVFNFAGMLAYNYLTAIAPILLALLAIGGIVLGTLSPETYKAFVQTIASYIPAGLGQTFVNAALTELRKNAGVLLAFAVIAAIFTGSRLFVALDNIFAVIFRVDVRPLIRQNIMAILMMLLFLILAPLAFLITNVPGAVLDAILPAGIRGDGLVSSTEGFVGGLLIACVMFGSMYLVVPNRKLKWVMIWPGALTAALLLILFEALFPIYQRLFLKGAGFGTVAGLALVILIFLYYVGVITLLGAEINAWAGGLRPLGSTLPQLFRQERREGVGNAPGVPSAGVSRTQPPTGLSGLADRVNAARSAITRRGGARRSAHPTTAMRPDEAQ